MLRTRLISGSLLGAGIIVLMIGDALLAQWSPRWYVRGIDLGHWLSHGLLCTLLLLPLTVLTANELVRFAQIAGARPLRFETPLFAAGLVIGPYISFNLKPTTGWYDESWGMMWLALALGVAFLAQAVRRRTEHALLNLATTVFIVFYTGGLCGFMTKLRMEVGGVAGPVLLLFSMFVVKMTDVGAFFIGSQIGRRKLIEWLSPKKTWEGFVGGLAVAVLCALLIGTALHTAGIAPLRAGVLGWPWGLVWFGLFMGVASVAGDLCASLLKRDVAIKDSSSAIPGMGGVLDIFDSPLLAAPAAWFFWTRLAALAPP